MTLLKVVLRSLGRSKLILFLLTVCLVVQGCAHLEEMTPAERQHRIFADQAAKIMRDNEIYRLYAEQNNVEGYREFIARHPDNVNVEKARFAMQQLELTDCYDADCLKEFLGKYPPGALVDEARGRLQFVENKDLENELAKDYSFDLPLYRLTLKRLRKELIDTGKEKLSGFSNRFSMVKQEGKSYFRTSMIFSSTSFLPIFSSPQMVEELFDFLIAPQFDYLMIKFKKKQKIDGFSFEIVALDQLNSELQFYFSRDQIARYISGSLAKSLMLEQSLLIPAPVMTSLPKPVPAQKEQTKPTGAMPPPVVLPWTSEEDGVAKNGEFVRTSIPAFSLRYPRTWAVGKATEDWIFNANPQRLPSMQIQVLKTGAGTEGAAGQIALTEEIAKKTQEKLLQRGAEKSCLEHVKPMEDIGGLPSCEFLITWRARVPDAAAGGLRRAYEMFNIPTYGRVLFAKDHAVIILYTLTPQGTTNGRPEHADQMIKILNTLMPISESYLIPAEAAPATITRTALPKSENALFPNPDIELSTPLTALGPADRNIAETGRLIRTASPAFSLSYPPEWALTQKPDRFSLSAKSASSLPSLQVMIAKISGEPSAFLQSLAGDYEQALKKKGSNIDLLYNKQTDVYEGHRAFEFEIRYKLKGRSATRTVYGNVIAKNGYAVLLAGETEGEIDSLKDIFETIDLKSDNERF